MMALALVLFMQGQAPQPAEEKERSGSVGSPIGEAAARPEGYDGLVELGVSLGRAGNFAEAEVAFERAIALAPKRPEAHVEYGGLHFLQGRYEQATLELTRAVRIREDPYTRRLLASSLHLEGRSHEALDEWNGLGEPILKAVDIRGLEKMRPRFVRSELAFVNGAMLTNRQLRLSSLRLEEIGVFRRVQLRPIPLGDGTAKVDVSLAERRGLGPPGELLVTSIANAFQKKAQLRYTNLDGAGLSLGASYRWQATQPELSVSLSWPHPLGLPVHLRVDAQRAAPQYDLEERFTLRRKAVDLRLRSVLGAHTVGEWGFRLSQRRTSLDDAPPKTLSAVQLGLDRCLVDRWRHRIDASLRAWVSSGSFGSDIRTHRALAQLKYRFSLSRPEGGAIEPSALVARATWGNGGSQMPIDEMFAPGAAAESAFPLRGHPQKRGGVLGGAPIGRSLTLLNVEWRRRLWRQPAFSLGGAVFYDGARPTGTIQGQNRLFHDMGIGLRFGLLRTVLRVDYARSLTGDGKSALTAGLGQAF